MKVASYVQTRGSIPLFWSQKPSLKWEPKVAISDNHEQSMKASKLHMQEQKDFYGKVALINLIDKKNSQ